MGSTVSGARIKVAVELPDGSSKTIEGMAQSIDVQHVPLYGYMNEPVGVAGTEVKVKMSGVFTGGTLPCATAEELRHRVDRFDDLGLSHERSGVRLVRVPLEQHVARGQYAVKEYNLYCTYYVHPDDWALGDLLAETAIRPHSRHVVGHVISRQREEHRKVKIRKSAKLHYEPVHVNCRCVVTPRPFLADAMKGLDWKRIGTDMHRRIAETLERQAAETLAGRTWCPDCMEYHS